jgi:hypothetical protein
MLMRERPLPHALPLACFPIGHCWSSHSLTFLALHLFLRYLFTLRVATPSTFMGRRGRALVRHRPSASQQRRNLLSALRVAHRLNTHRPLATFDHLRLARLAVHTIHKFLCNGYLPHKIRVCTHAHSALTTFAVQSQPSFIAVVDYHRIAFFVKAGELQTDRLEVTTDEFLHSHFHNVVHHNWRALAFAWLPLYNTEPLPLFFRQVFVTVDCAPESVRRARLAIILDALTHCQSVGQVGFTLPGFPSFTPPVFELTP